MLIFTVKIFDFIENLGKHYIQEFVSTAGNCCNLIMVKSYKMKASYLNFSW